MSRSQDTVIDDDEETCPLCIEEFDLSDKNFRPCPCGYQICQFCFNSLKTTYEKSTCPNCRRPYDEKTIQYKIPTAEEFKLDLQNKNKKQAAARRKETEKREVETSSRRNLAGVRVKQQNLVYVIGLIPQIKDESALLQTLRGPDYFGQYGDIEKIVVSKAKAGAPNQGVGVYVTYARKEDAALCINTVDGSMNGDRVLRAQFGTTKYCSAYLRGENCNNKNCSFLHETGEDGQHSSLQNEPHTRPLPKSTTSTQAANMVLPPRPLSTTHSVTSQTMARQNSIDETDSRQGSTDASALPSTASWANGGAPLSKTRGSSLSAGGATPSPQITYASPASNVEEVKTKEVPAAQGLPTLPKSTASESLDKPIQKPKPFDPVQAIFDNVLRNVSSQDFQFVFSDSCLTEEERSTIDYLPVMIDPYGGAKRRVMQDKEAAERARIESDAKAKLEAQATSAAEDAMDDENMGAGSLALGGEPEDNPRNVSARGAIQRPSQMSSSAFLHDQFANISLNNRSLTPQQRQQLAVLSPSNVQQAPGLSQPPAQNTAFEMSDFERRAPQYSAAQYEQINNHQRHGSRYFNSESKSSSSNRFQGQQQAFYSSGVQGPPPGLPTAGTPPVSGGGMFAHGQGFTNPGFGTAKDTNAELHMRGRSGTNAGPDTSKRGGEHLVDPSIVQARMHQGNSTGQGLFGGNQVDEKNFPPLPVHSETQPSALHSRVSSFQSLHSSAMRSSTPKIPPGFETSHGHPPHLPDVDSLVGTPESTPQRAGASISAPVIPAVPLLPFGQRATTPKPKPQDMPKDSERTSLTDESTMQASIPATIEPKVVGGSLGSPSQSGLRQQREASKTTGKGESQDRDSPLPKPSDSKAEEMSSIQKPMKIEIPRGIAAAGPSQSFPGGSKPSTPIVDSSIVGTPPAMSSRPATPATMASEISRASIPRPRTLRVTTGMTPKSEQAPASATTERSSIPPSLPLGKSASRQDSISSIPRSRPSTPAMSEQLNSHDVSRASSPHPSIIGSAPERIKTKNQQKKDRREKAKKSTEVPDTASVAPTTSVPEPVGPIVARQKKQKKQKDGLVTDDTQLVQPPQEPKVERKEVDKSPKKQDPAASSKARDGKKDSAATPPTKAPMSKPDTPILSEKEDEPIIPEMPKAPYTLRDLYNDASKLSVDGSDPIQKLLSEHTSPMSKIISSLIADGYVAKDHPWLNPPSFNSAAYKLASDGRKGQEYLDANGYSTTDAFGYVYLPQKKKRALYADQAVSIADSGDRKNDLLHRCLITPNGWVMRHLSAEESEKVLELEERRVGHAEEHGNVGVMTGLGALEQDDFMNLEGGIEELDRRGERHGVCWVQGDDQDEDAAAFGDLDDDEDDEDDDEAPDGDVLSDETDDLGIDLDGSVNMPGAWDAAARGGSVAAQQRLNTLPRSQDQAGRNVNLRALDLESLQKRVQEKHKEFEAARKEVEKMEKAFAKKQKDIGRWRETVLKA